MNRFLVKGYVTPGENDTWKAKSELVFPDGDTMEKVEDGLATEAEAIDSMKAMIGEAEQLLLQLGGGTLDVSSSVN